MISERTLNTAFILACAFCLLLFALSWSVRAVWAAGAPNPACAALEDGPIMAVCFFPAAMAAIILISVESNRWRPEAVRALKVCSIPALVFAGSYLLLKLALAVAVRCPSALL